MTEKTDKPALGRYQIARLGPSHSRWEMPDGPNKGKPIYGPIPPTAIMVNYSAGKHPGDRRDILLTEADAVKLSHMGLIRILDGGSTKIITPSEDVGVTARDVAEAHHKRHEANAAAKAAAKAAEKPKTKAKAEALTAEQAGS